MTEPLEDRLDYVEAVAIELDGLGLRDSLRHIREALDVSLAVLRDLASHQPDASEYADDLDAIEHHISLIRLA